MASTPPPVDPRSAEDVAAQLQRLLVHYLAEGYGWQAGDDGGEPGRALTGVCAHYAGLVIDRINRAPRKNLLAFLDLLGNSLTPPQPAQVPLTFFLDAAATGGVPVPAGTRVQAPAGESGGEPVDFETDRDLWLCNFQLRAMDMWDEGATQPRDLTGGIVGPDGAPAGVGERLFDERETLYLGLSLAPGRALESGREVALHFFLDALQYDSTSPASALPSSPRVAWEYLSGTSQEPLWRPLPVEDGTAELTHSGPLRFLVPQDFACLQRRRFEATMYWVRGYLLAPSEQALPSSDLGGNRGSAVRGPAPLLQAAALNSVPASQAVTIRDEVLGSSDGSAGQVFRGLRKPMLAGERVEVLELRLAVGQAVTAPADWTPWQGVADFHASGPQDRHYLVDRQSGEIRFGDGQRGMLPPRGTRNVRLAAYRTGGGPAGNIPAGPVKLTGGGRFIEKVVNAVAAQDGAVGETTQALIERAPRALRHRGRAVTFEDYEDLARLSSADVARALCVPLIDLAREPVKVINTLADEEAGAGQVSVIVVPRSGSANPLPGWALIRQVEGDLRQCGGATAAISVVGPIYLRVAVSAHIKLQAPNLAHRVAAALQQALTAWLHPLTGQDGAGWPFGREPSRSDIHRLVTAIEGVDHVINLALDTVADVPPLGWAQGLPAVERTRKVRETGRFLVCSGQHDLRLY